MERVRRAAKKDMPEIMELLRQVLNVHHGGRPDLFKEAATKYTEEELRGILQNDRTPVFVCVDENDRAMGYAFCVWQQHVGDNILTDIKTLYIDDLCVDEKKRGQHIGRTLYEYVLDYARENGFYNVTLNVWALNESARRFYEGCGLSVQKIGMEKVVAIQRQATEL